MIRLLLQTRGAPVLLQTRRALITIRPDTGFSGYLKKNLAGYRIFYQFEYLTYNIYLFIYLFINFTIIQKI
jgi:hypothetical protein